MGRVETSKWEWGPGFKGSRAQNAAKAQWPNKANSSQGVGGQLVNVVVAANGAEERREGERTKGEVRRTKEEGRRNREQGTGNREQRMVRSKRSKSKVHVEAGCGAHYCPVENAVLGR